jgi:pantoate--beta-alanine ligase
MQTVNKKTKIRATTQRWKSEGEIVAFVPTMGNLHEGHLKLVDMARQHASKVVVSIFVNPTQFAAGEDIDSYPRTLEHDSTLLAERGADLLFAPDNDEIYADQSTEQTRVEVPGLSAILCGESRPTHFVGVTTVVAKLFNIVQPDLAVFGEKDFQQLFLIKKMVKDLDFPVKILGAGTVREDSGLAMSSRNNYLSATQRMRAALLYKCLQQTAASIADGERNYAKLEENAAKILENYGFEADYVSIRKIQDLQVASENDQELVILAAVRLGKARLIDNIKVDLSGTIKPL